MQSVIVKRAAIVMLLLVAGCSDDLGPVGVTPQTGVDAGFPDVTDVADATTSTDLGSDAERDATSAPDIAWVEVELDDGSTLEGELVATYEMSRWWDARPGLLYALFNSTKYRPYPNDRSLQFVESTETAAIRDAEPLANHIPYRGFLRDRGIYIRQPPFDAAAYVITGNESYHLEENGFGDFAWDFEITDDDGHRFDTDGTTNEDYFVWETEVLSGVSGEVIDVVESSPDNLPGEHPEYSEAINNWVGISLGGSYYVYYLHFRQDGVFDSIAPGTYVTVGTPLGLVGNSGVTLEPHIHVVLLWYDVDAERSYSVPVEFQTIDISPTPVGPFAPRDWYVPSTGEWLLDAL